MTQQFRPGEPVRIVGDSSVGVIDEDNPGLTDGYIAVLFQRRPLRVILATDELERIPEEPMTTVEITPEWIERVASDATDDYFGPPTNHPTHEAMRASIRRAIARAIAPKPRVFRVTVEGMSPRHDVSEIKDALDRDPVLRAEVTVEEITE